MNNLIKSVSCAWTLSIEQCCKVKEILSGHTGWVKYLNCYSPHFDQTLNLGSWEQLEQISTVMGIFVQATFVLATFVHIRNISAVTDSILTKL